MNRLGVLDEMLPSLLMPVNQEADDPLTGGDRHCKLGELLMKDFTDDGVERRAEVHKCQ